MNLSHLALFGVIIAFGFAYISTLKSSARQSSALRFALSLPLLIVSSVAIFNPRSVFSLSAIGVKSGEPLSGLSLYPNGPESIKDLTLNFSVTHPDYWAFIALGLSLLTLVISWRAYRSTVKSGRTPGLWSAITHFLWVGLWALFLSQVPVNIGEIDGGETGIKTVLAINQLDVSPTAYVIRQEYWIYAPEQWYLVLIAFISAGLSLLSLAFTPQSKPVIHQPIWSAIGAIFVLVVMSVGLTDLGFIEQSCLWMITMLLCAASFLNLPSIQRHVVLVSSLVLLVGLY